MISKPSTTDRKSEAALERSREQELWHKLVVKVISWSDGLKYGGIIKEVDKISLKEWKTYCSRYIKTNTSHDKTRVDTDLQRTKEAIESFGGFEKN